VSGERTTKGTESSGTVRDRIFFAIQELEHVLPGQAPIKDFVHHNTLHGLEHLPFPEAVAHARRLTGAAGYLPLEHYRALHRRGRINDADLIGVLDAEEQLKAAEILLVTEEGPVTRRSVYLAALLHPLDPITDQQLGWQIEELQALERLQVDVAPEARQSLLRAAGRSSESQAVCDLWSACLAALGVKHAPLHPEDLFDLSPEQAEAMFAELETEEALSDSQLLTQRHLHRAARRKLQALLDRVGGELTLTGLLKALTGHELLEDLRPYLIRQLGNFLDLGTAAWHRTDPAAGLYASWRRGLDSKPTWILEELYDWHHHIEELPEDPLDAVVEELERLALPRERWEAYLERLALELPGWSGMVLRREMHPHDQRQGPQVRMLDYLAVRLALERLFALRLCAAEWGIEPNLDLLRWQFRRNPSELLVRHALFNERLPEYLTTRAQRLLQQTGPRGGGADSAQWQTLAQLIWTWQQSPDVDRPGRGAWPLFRLAQHLGLPAAVLRALAPPQIEGILECLRRLDPDTTGFIWLRAYESHYRNQIFNALLSNHGRGRWSDRERRPSAQLVFCMDDREEGIRRQLEEIDPEVETLGAAAHFGVPSYWRGLDDKETRGLCPVGVVPSHEVREIPRPGCERLFAEHRQRRGWRARLRDVLHQEVRRNLLSSSAVIAAAAPGAALALAGKVFAPRLFGRWAQRLQLDFDKQVPTDIAITGQSTEGTQGPETPKLGFTTEEQAQRVGNLLETIGLAQGFAPLVVIMGHGSDSDNNPHLAAYNCGACSGNHSGPNARMLATMANRPEVRELLRARRIDIPDDCWFLGAEHNTCDEAITWYDRDRLPKSLREASRGLERRLQQALGSHAHERCRKFYSAPPDPTPQQALHHTEGRGVDFSQARPELGHATNACAFIGRRSMSQGVFFDRRAFLISYDPMHDPDGLILEGLLLANGPVGAGINLEYYFSTVDNERYGAGSKVTHNVVGFFGVIDGAASDLRTGLPRQMIEVHEAMRLLVIVEAKLDLLTAIYQRQPPLQRLIGNGWILLAAKDPDAPVIHTFDPTRGWLRWEGPIEPLPTVQRSADHYAGTMDPLEPVLIAQPEVAVAR